MKIEAHKLSGLGNIILIVDLVRQPGHIGKDEILKIASERNGDFDQLITIEPPKETTVDLRAKIFNVDGSEAMNCINGARCVAKYVLESRLLPKKKFSVSTLGGTWYLEEKLKGEFEVQMAPPNFIKGRENFPEVGTDKSIPLAVNGIAIEFFFVNLGNPHAVCLVDDINDYPLSEIGEALQTHNFFPDGVNLGFAKINSRKSLDLRVFERGAGETLACGSGACAAAVIGNNAGLLDSEVLVKFQEGSLNINYEKHSGKLVASGSADYLSKLSLEI